MVLPEMASEAAGVRTWYDTFLQKTAQLCCLCGLQQQKGTKKQPTKLDSLPSELHNQWSHAKCLCPFVTTVKMCRIIPSVELFSPILAVFLEPLFWQAHETALEAISEEAHYCVQAMIMATTGKVEAKKG